VLAAELYLDIIFPAIPQRFEVSPVPAFPPVLEDLAVVVDESIPAEQVDRLIRQAGGRTVTSLRLFDVYRGDQVGPGKKSLAYSLTYQNPERTLTDAEVAGIRQRIVRRLEQEYGARLRS
jgi:phenylalanyl-tRNA synthetase beta chain